MSGRKRLMWTVWALAGVLGAGALGWLAAPLASPTGEPVSGLAMKARGSTGVSSAVSRRVPDPSPEDRPVTSPVEEDAEDAVRDRADWIADGAVVTCALPGVPAGSSVAFLDLHQGMGAGGAVDVMSRLQTPVEDGVVRFTVREARGESRLFLPDLSEDDDEEGGANDADVRARAFRVRWGGATAGRAVSCEEVVEEPVRSVTVSLAFAPGDALPRGAVPIGVRGCGMWVPMGRSEMRIDLAAGACTLQVERRHPDLPAIVAHGEPVPVQSSPGRTTRVVLVVPPEPPLTQPPDPDALAAAADMAAYTGDDAMAEELEALQAQVEAGAWEAGAVVDRRDEADQDLALDEARAELLLELEADPAFMEALDAHPDLADLPPELLITLYAEGKRLQE